LSFEFRERCDVLVFVFWSVDRIVAAAIATPFSAAHGLNRAKPLSRLPVSICGRCSSVMMQY